MDEINEEHDESLDNFLFSSSLSRDWKSNANLNFKRFETENNRVNSSFSKDKIVTNNLVDVTYSNADQIQDNSFQEAHSELFLESQK